MLRRYAAVGLILISGCAEEPYRMLSSTVSLCAECRYSCEPTFSQAEPISIEIEECLLEAPDVRIETEEYEFSDGNSILRARSYLSTPDEADVLGRRSEHESDALSGEELRGPLLEAALEFLRARGKTRINILTPDSFPGRRDHYAPLPTRHPGA